MLKVRRYSMSAYRRQDRYRRIITVLKVPVRLADSKMVGNVPLSKLEPKPHQGDDQGTEREKSPTCKDKADEDGKLDKSRLGTWPL